MAKKKTTKEQLLKKVIYLNELCLEHSREKENFKHGIRGMESQQQDRDKKIRVLERAIINKFIKDNGGASDVILIEHRMYDTVSMSADQKEVIIKLD